MAVTAFCWPRRSPFIAAAAGPRARAPPRGGGGREGGDCGHPAGRGGRMGGEESPAVIQRRLHVGPAASDPGLRCLGPDPSPQLFFRCQTTCLSPQAPSPFLFTFRLHFTPSVGNSPKVLSLCSHSSAVRAAFLTTPWPPCGFFFFPLLHSYPHTFLFFCPFSITFFFTHILCLITSPCFWHLFALPL